MIHAAPTIWSSPSGSIIQGDCIEVMRMIAPESVQCVFADPPFSLGKDYGGPTDDFTPRGYQLWCTWWLNAAINLLESGGALFVYNLQQHALAIGAHLQQVGMTFRNWIAVKQTNRPGIKGRLYPAHYALLYFTKGPPRVFNRIHVPTAKCRHCKKELRSYGSYKKIMHPDGVTLSDFWDDCPPVNQHQKDLARVGGQGFRNNGKRDRQSSSKGNQLNPEIVRRCVLTSTDPGDLVLDPFLGERDHGGGLHAGRTPLDRDRDGRLQARNSAPGVNIMIEQVISGGQTGTDQGALEAAKAARIATGGWAPKGWITESGPAPWLQRVYGLKECRLGLTTAEVYRERTRENIKLCNGVIVIGDASSPGSQLVRILLDVYPREQWWVSYPGDTAVDALAHDLNRKRPRILMIAGNRQSHRPALGPEGNHKVAVHFCARLFAYLDDLGAIHRPAAQRALFDAHDAPAVHRDPNAYGGSKKKGNKR